MGPLVLAKNFLMVSAGGQAFRSQWVPVDSEFLYATIHVHCQTLSPTSPPTGYEIKVESSFDTVESYQVGSTITVALTGSQSAAVTADLGPLVRLVIENPESFAMIAIVSVWLQVKST